MNIARYTRITQKGPYSSRNSSLRLLDIRRTVWLIFAIGLILGIMLTLADKRIDGAAVAILSMAPLMFQLNAHLFPGFLFGPITLMYLYHALGYAIGPLWQLHVIGYLYRIYPEGLVPAQWGGVLGLLTFALVFPAVFKHASHWSQPTSGVPVRNQDRWGGYAVLLLALVGGSIAYGFGSGAYNRLGGLDGGPAQSSLISALNPLHYALFFFLGHLATRPGLRWKVIWLAALIAYSVFHFLDGGRGAAAFAVIFSANGLVWGGVPRRMVILGGLVSLLLLVPISGIVLDYRNRTVNVGTDVAPRVDQILISTNDYFYAQSKSLASSTEAFVRAVTVGYVDRVFLLTPSIIPFAGLEGLEKAIYAVTPRLINPNRPELDDGNQLAIRYGATAIRGNYMPAVGDGYRRGGWPSVILLYAFITAVFATALAVAWNHRHRREWLAMFIFLTFQSSQIWSTTALAALIYILWLFPRTFITFWAISRAQAAFLKLFGPRPAMRARR